MCDCCRVWGKFVVDYWVDGTFVAWQLLSMKCFQILFCSSATVEIDASQFSLAHSRVCVIGHVIHTEVHYGSIVTVLSTIWNVYKGDVDGHVETR